MSKKKRRKDKGRRYEYTHPSRQWIAVDTNKFMDRLEKYPEIKNLVTLCEFLSKACWKEFREDGIARVYDTLDFTFKENFREGNKEMPWIDLMHELEHPSTECYLLEKLSETV